MDSEKNWYCDRPPAVTVLTYHYFNLKLLYLSTSFLADEKWYFCLYFKTPEMNYRPVNRQYACLSVFVLQLYYLLKETSIYAMARLDYTINFVYSVPRWPFYKTTGADLI